MKNLLLLLFLIPNLVMALDKMVNVQVVAAQSFSNKIEDLHYMNHIAMGFSSPSREMPTGYCTITNIEITNSCAKDKSLYSNGIYITSESRDDASGLKCSIKETLNDVYEIIILDSLPTISSEYKFIFTTDNRLVDFVGKRTRLDLRKKKYEIVNYIPLKTNTTSGMPNKIPTDCKNFMLYNDLTK